MPFYYRPHLGFPGMLLLHGPRSFQRCRTGSVARQWQVSKWIPSLDAARGIAALAVVFGHQAKQDEIAGSAWPVLKPALVSAGGWGVVLFFLLSGFCIHLPQARRAAAGGELRLPSTMAFYRQRLRRLGPAYLLALVLSAAAGAWFGASSLITPPTWSSFLSHLFFIHGWTGHFEDLNAPLWSIGVEMHFYLFYPLLLALYRRWGSARTTAGLFVLGMVLYLFVSLLIGPGTRVAYQRLFIVIWWQWSLGAWVAEVYCADRPPAWFARLITFRGAWVVWGLATWIIPYGDVVVFRLHSTAYVQFVFFTLLLGAIVVTPWRPSVPFRIFTYVGDQSYSLYLLHPVALTALWPVAARLQLGPRSTMLLLVAASLVLSRLAYELVEKPTMRPRSRVLMTAPITPVSG